MNTRTGSLLAATLAFCACWALLGCGGGASEKPAAPPGSASNPLPAKEEGGAESAPVRPGMFTSADINLGELDKAMADKGMATYNVKCQACHSLGTNRVVGPGWKGLLEKRKPEWIMNMIVHTDAMLSDDAEAQKMLEECLVRMPNQNLSKDEAREVVEFMRTI